MTSSILRDRITDFYKFKDEIHHIYIRARTSEILSISEYAGELWSALNTFETRLRIDAALNASQDLIDFSKPEIGIANLIK